LSDSGKLKIYEGKVPFVKERLAVFAIMGAKRV